jgi:hypothetical protein
MRMVEVLAVIIRIGRLVYAWFTDLRSTFLKGGR